MRYRVLFQLSAARQVRKLTPDLQKRIVARAEALAADPRPPGCEELKGPTPFWRVRVGDYRIVYEIKDNVLLVLVVRVAHRREVYRDV
jgi:mRNA interferase RelE/StbE